MKQEAKGLALCGVVLLGVAELEATARLAPNIADYLQPDVPTGPGHAIPRFNRTYLNGSNFNAGATAVAGPLSGWRLSDEVLGREFGS